MNSALRVGINTLFWDQPATGSGQYVRHLVRHLARQDSELGLLLVTPDHVEIDDAPEGAWVVPVQRRLKGQIGKLLFEQVMVSLLSQHLEARLIHVPYFAPPLFSPLPVVVTIHDLIPLILPAYRGGLHVRTYTSLVAQAARRAERVLTDSRASALDIISHLEVSPDRVQVIPLAADETFVPVPAEDDRALTSLRQRLDLPADYLLYLGGFDRRKQVPELLKAYAQSGLVEHGLPLLIAGRLPHRDTSFAPDPRPIADELKLGAAVRFVGWVDESSKPALYRGARVFCFPSAYEGFGLPVLEALSCGTAVIAGKGSSLDEVTGPGGLLVPGDDVDALSDALRRLATDNELRTRLAAEGLAHAQNYSWEATADATARVYREVADA